MNTTKGNNEAALVIPYPFLLVVLAAFVMYLPSFFFDVTMLDDFVFIKQAQHNSNLSGLFTAFTRGVFQLQNDYYRPIFTDSMLLNAHLAGGSIMGYHVINVLLHAIASGLLLRLLVQLHMRQLHAFILALVFAVHPVLTQAVAWIPGRNDTLLAIFSFAFFSFSIGYTSSSKLKDLLLSVLFFLLALFTKEAAVCNAVVAMILLTGVLQKKWQDKACIIQYAAWLVCGIAWLALRHTAHVASMHLSPLAMAKEFAGKLPAVLQYTGKIFLPFNLSVYPLVKDTSNYYGFFAIVILLAIVVLSSTKNMRIVFCGLAIFLVFILPALLVPNYMSLNTFEHRLYLPFLGMCVLLPETILFKNKLGDRQLLALSAGTVAIMATINYRHQQHFATPLTFWTQAVKTSPSSAPAHLMLALQVKDLQQARQLVLRAGHLNPKARHLNYTMGILLQKQDSLLASEKYLLAEKAISGYYMCDFYLAKVALAKNDYPAAINWYKQFVRKDPNNTPALARHILNNPNWQRQDSATVMVARAIGYK